MCESICTVNGFGVQIYECFAVKDAVGKGEFVAAAA